VSAPTPTLGIRQRRFGGPSASIQEQGDCWATAVASYAGLTNRDRNELHRRIVLSDLALARSAKNPQEGGAWWNVTQRFLTEHERLPIGWAWKSAWELLDPGAVYIASGPSPRGNFDHSVLAFGDGTLYWDPHPSGAGLVEVTEFCGWYEVERQSIFGVQVGQVAA
jgi:hypothetical protein